MSTDLGPRAYSLCLLACLLLGLYGTAFLVDAHTRREAVEWPARAQALQYALHVRERDAASVEARLRTHAEALVNAQRQIAALEQMLQAAHSLTTQ